MTDSGCLQHVKVVVIGIFRYSFNLSEVLTCYSELTTCDTDNDRRKRVALSPSVYSNGEHVLYHDDVDAELHQA